MKRFSPCTLLIYHNTAKVPAHEGGSPRLQDAPKLSSRYPLSLPQYLFCTFLSPTSLFVYLRLHLELILW